MILLLSFLVGVVSAEPSILGTCATSSTNTLKPGIPALFMAFTDSHYYVYKYDLTSCDGFSLVQSGTALIEGGNYGVSDFLVLECGLWIDTGEFTPGYVVDGSIFVVTADQIVTQYSVVWDGTKLQFDLGHYSVIRFPFKLPPSIQAIDVVRINFISLIELAGGVQSSMVAIATESQVATFSLGGSNVPWVLNNVSLASGDIVNKTSLSSRTTGGKLTVLFGREIVPQEQQASLRRTFVHLADVINPVQDPVQVPSYFFSHPVNVFVELPRNHESFSLTSWAQQNSSTGVLLAVSEEDPTEKVTMVDNWDAENEVFLDHRESTYLNLQPSGDISFNQRAFLSHNFNQQEVRLFAMGAEKPVLTASTGGQHIVDFAAYSFGNEFTIMGAVAQLVSFNQDQSLNVTCVAKGTAYERPKWLQRPKLQSPKSTGSCIFHRCNHECCVQNAEFEHVCSYTCNGCNYCNKVLDECMSSNSC